MSPASALTSNNALMRSRDPSAAAAVRLASNDPSAVEKRKLFGEFVGNTFYGAMLKQMNDSKIKGKYFHGGRGEEAFRGQLALELGKRMGQSPTDPLTNRLFTASQPRTGRSQSADGADPTTVNEGFPAQAPQRAYPTAAPAREYPAGSKMEFAA